MYSAYSGLMRLIRNLKLFRLKVISLACLVFEPHIHIYLSLIAVAQDTSFKRKKFQSPMEISLNLNLGGS